MFANFLVAENITTNQNRIIFQNAARARQGRVSVSSKKSWTSYHHRAQRLAEMKPVRDQLGFLVAFFPESSSPFDVRKTLRVG
jgi:hypothetical protein